MQSHLLHRLLHLISSGNSLCRDSVSRPLLRASTVGRVTGEVNAPVVAVVRGAGQHPIHCSFLLGSWRRRDRDALLVISGKCLDMLRVRPI